MTLLLFFAFLSGLATILAPCVWPILPIILSASASGGHRRPLGIVSGIAVSFTFFTLALSYILRVIPFDPDRLRLFAAVVIALLGVTFVVPFLGRILEGWVSRLSALGGRFTGNQGDGFSSGFVTGAALGILWSPCAGPILATVAALAATQSVNWEIILVTIAFVAGISVPLFILALVGQAIFTRSRRLNPYLPIIQRIFGVIMILAALAIYTGYDRILQTKIIETLPAFGMALSGLEKNTFVQKELQRLQFGDAGAEVAFTQDEKISRDQNPGRLPVLGVAPDFVGIRSWLNTDGAPVTLKDLRGKVVLVDFWTYSCINCIRTLPYVTGWYEKYKDDGFVVIGIHTPEFEFEKKQSNVEAAVQQYGIHYPVALDNDYATWTAYENRYWPAHYLIDAEGNVRQTHFGEGQYGETEAAIRDLLREKGNILEEASLEETSNETPILRNQTPETYLGSNRMERFSSPEPVEPRERRYSAPSILPLHHFALDGPWSVEAERSISGPASALDFRFDAGRVFLVLGPPLAGSIGRVRVLLDGQPIDPANAGESVGSDGVVSVDAERLYELVKLPSDAPTEHQLGLEFEGAGVSVYAFTFGR